MLPTDGPFRVFLALLVFISIWALTQRPSFHLPLVPEHINLSVLGLVSLGLVTFSLTSEPYKAGLGFLTFITGFELFYSAANQSLPSLAIFAAANLVITLIVAYLTQLRHSFNAFLD
jgi:hypothetical protein